MKITTLFLSFVLMTSAFAADGDKKFERGDYLKKELNLTDEQLAKVKEIRKSGKDEMRSDRKEFKKLKSDFKAAMKDPKSSNEDLTAKFEAFQKARDEFQRNRFKMMLKMREILSPDQLQKFMEMKKKHKGKWKKRMDKRKAE